MQSRPPDWCVYHWPNRRGTPDVRHEWSVRKQIDGTQPHLHETVARQRSLDRPVLPNSWLLRARKVIPTLCLSSSLILITVPVQGKDTCGYGRDKIKISRLWRDGVSVKT